MYDFRRDSCTIRYSRESSNIWTCICIVSAIKLFEVMHFFVFLENRLCARVLDIGGIGGKRGIGDIGGKGGIGDIGGIGGVGDIRGKGDRGDLRKRHQSFAHTLTLISYPAVYVAESVCSSTRHPATT